MKKLLVLRKYDSVEADLEKEKKELEAFGFDVVIIPMGVVLEVIDGVEEKT